MLGRHRTEPNPSHESAAPLRSSIADAAWAVEERLVWGTVDILRSIGEIVKWPFQRIAWAVERWLLWPLQERTGGWSTPLRALAGLGAVALAAGATAAGLLLAKGTDGSETVTAVAPSLTQTAVAAAPGPPSLPFRSAPPSTPLLKGTAPDFSPEADGGTAKAAGAVSDAVPASAAGKAGLAPPSSPAKTKAKTAGPAAIKVARRFAGAFVLYETARGKKSKIRGVFDETATPQLTRSLMKRPPRLPANVQVPEAKVLNIVPGPRSGDIHTFSVSLLRVGVTSELRIDMRRAKKSGKWQVTDVLG